MVGFILCLWFNLDMVSPSSPNHPKAFGRIALVGKYQADGIADHLHELAKLAGELACATAAADLAAEALARMLPGDSTVSASI